MKNSRPTRSSRRCILRGLFLFAALLFFPGRASLLSSSILLPAQAGAVISITSELVTLPVAVTDSRGNFVHGLTRQNFRVYEDGQLQELSWFQQEDAPVAVGLIVDHSGSMRTKLPGVAASISAFARSVNPGDRMFVVDFGDAVTVDFLSGKAFTQNPAEIERDVDAVSAQGRTALYDAVAEGFIHLQLAASRKRALIVVSDGGDNASVRKYPEILRMARQSQTVIYSIGLLDESGEEENPAILQRLARDTGGLAFFPGAGESIAGAMTAIARDLREQYTLGYAPKKSGGDAFRKIQVKVTAPGAGKLLIRARPGYLPSSDDQSAP